MKPLPSVTHVVPFLVGLALFAAIGVVDQARGVDLWRNYAWSGVVLGLMVTAAVWLPDVRIPHYIQWVIVGALILHYGGGSLASAPPDAAYHHGLLGMHGVNGAYHVYEGWDNLTHGAGIGAGSMAIAYLLEVYQVRRGLRWTAFEVATVAFCAGLAAGVGVELYEYLGKAAFQTIDQGGYANTMADLQFNALGAALGAGIAAGVNRTAFARRIRDHWGEGPAAPPRTRLPPAMVGFVVFVALPAAVTLVLALRFFTQDIAPEDDARLYDPALHLLVGVAVAAAVLGPLSGLAARRLRGSPG